MRADKGERALGRENRAGMQRERTAEAQHEGDDRSNQIRARVLERRLPCHPHGIAVSVNPESRVIRVNEPEAGTGARHRHVRDAAVIGIGGQVMRLKGVVDPRRSTSAEDRHV